MYDPDHRHLRFTQIIVRNAIRYHLRELGLCRELEEGLLERIEKNMGNKRIYVAREHWQQIVGDIERATVLFQIAGIGEDELKQTNLGTRFLAVQENYHRVDGLA